MNTGEFRDIVGKDIWKRMDHIRRMGNAAAHSSPACLSCGSRAGGSFFFHASIVTFQIVRELGSENFTYVNIVVDTGKLNLAMAVHPPVATNPNYSLFLLIFSQKHRTQFGYQ